MHTQEVLKILDVKNTKVILDFFVFFSRLEYSMKRTENYCRNTTEPKPDWEKLKNDLDKEFKCSKSEELNTACQYLVENPPKKIFKEEGSLTFKKGTFGSEKEGKNLINIIRTIRNNLFHGGKFQNEEQTDITRDEDLLKNSLVILDETLNLIPEIKEHFYSF